MEILEAYNEWAPMYDVDRNITRDLDAAVTEKLLAMLPAKRILELGCGTGKNTRTFAHHGQEVLAIDGSDSMLAIAQSRVLNDHVRFVRANVCDRWPTEDQAADLVSCNLVLQHIPDLNVVFSESKRSLIVGGHLYISELHPIKRYQGSMAPYVRHGQDVPIPAYTHHISGFLHAGESYGFSLIELNEWWHSEDSGKAPRLVSFLFRKL